MLLLALLNFLYALYFFTMVPIAPIAVLKMFLCIACACGLLKLIDGWWAFMVFIAGFALLVIPFEILLMVSSAEFYEFVASLTGIRSRAVLVTPLVVAFATFLWMFMTLRRGDVARAFDSEQATPATWSQRTVR